MACKKLIDDNEDLDVTQNGAVTEVVEEELSHDERTLQEIIDSLGSEGAEVQVFYRGPTEMVAGYIGAFPAPDFNYEVLARKYGGGDYRLKFIVKGRIKQTLKFKVHSSIKGELTSAQIDAIKKEPTSDVQAVIAGMNSALDQKRGEVPDTATLLSVQSNQMKEYFMMMAEERRSSRESLMTLITALAPVLATVLAPRQAPNAEAFAVLAEMAKSKASTQGSLGEAINALRGLKDITDIGTPEESFSEKMMKYAGPVLAAIIANAPAQTPRLPGAPIVNTGVPQPVVPQQVAPTMPVTQTPPPAMAQDQQAAFEVAARTAAYVDLLIIGAVKNADPTLYADLVETTVTELELAQLKAVLASETWLTDIFGADPRVAQQATWFGELRDAILNEDDDDEDDDEEGSEDPSPEVIPNPQKAELPVKAKKKL